eukprot:2864252-Rhodomonas_salina.6
MRGEGTSLSGERWQGSEMMHDEQCTHTANVSRRQRNPSNLHVQCPSKLGDGFGLWGTFRGPHEGQEDGAESDEEAERVRAGAGTALRGQDRADPSSLPGLAHRA